ncbi:methionyl-tRNA formyltransferase [Mycoplasmoides pneumoniae]|uniref:methionyl-tRNA formyltransferase n=1 Tax=Mycoplasmoides pneumoniae TaxID=2104 RepID=UPI0006A74B3B|nr:methionyl-tRNA formyltransferase [Mycoplasmoides pneumoniae]ALA38162.1 methionyl-tRNA formyltransferase [Mycoplasmoides pneumoniae M2592]
MIKVVFFGTSTLSKCCLEAIFQDPEFVVCGVVTQPDKVNERNNKINFSAVKQFCIENNIPCFQPEKNIQIKTELAQLQADIGVCVAFGQYIHNDIINLFPYKIANLHPSKLPLLRGGAPLHWTIINGFTTSSLSVIELVQKMDSGPIWKQKDFKVNPNWNTGDLFEYVQTHAPQFLIQCLKEIVSGKSQWKEQINPPTFGFNIKKEQERLDLNLEPKAFINWVKGLAPKPGGWLEFEGQNIKILQATYLGKMTSTTAVGQITKISKQGIEIALANDEIVLLQIIQIPGKRAMGVSEIINGKHPFAEGKFFH